MLRRLELTSIAVLVGMISFASGLAAETRAGPCAPNAAQLVVCGSGSNPLVVLDDTASPTARLAIAWRSKVEPKGELPDAADVENHLVRLADGQSLALVVGRAWSNGRGRSNHVYQTTAWSPDGRWLVVGDGGKWSLEAIAVYAVDESTGKVARQGFFVDLRDAATEALEKRVGRGKVADYYFDLRGDTKITIGNDGRISIPIVFQIPKQDGAIDGVARFKASRRGNKIERTGFDVSLAKGRS